MTKAILLDIEGTTTPIDFVHKTLFPYAKARVGGFVEDHFDELKIELAELAAEHKEDNGYTGEFRPDSPNSIADYLKFLIDTDRKSTPLKSIQGMNLSEVTDLSVIGTLFAFTIVCAGVLVKDKEFAGEKRFVPYVSSRFIGPAIFLIAWFVVIFAKGVSALDIPVFESFSTFVSSLTNSTIYQEGFNALAKFFTDFTPSSADIEAGHTTTTRVFFERLPYFVFMIFSLVMAILCFVKRLSLIPVLGVMCCTYLMTELGWTNWVRFGIWMVVGFIVYFFYSYSHSHLHKGAAPEAS